MDDQWDVHIAAAETCVTPMRVNSTKLGRDGWSGDVVMSCVATVSERSPMRRVPLIFLATRDVFVIRVVCILCNLVVLSLCGRAYMYKSQLKRQPVVRGYIVATRCNCFPTRVHMYWALKVCLLVTIGNMYRKLRSLFVIVDAIATRQKFGIYR